MTMLARRATLALVLLSLAAMPAVAAPWCADYCDCSRNCWAQCYDESGSNACFSYICSGSPPCGSLVALDAKEQLLRVIAEPGTSQALPDAAGGSQGACSVTQDR